jgi:probable blue pigment (indigoidine) exporter
MQQLLAGLAFATLWATATVATKIGLQSGEPFLITNLRFAIAALIMLLWAHALRREAIPKGKEWKSLAIYGLLNCSIYLGIFVFAMRYCTAGIGTLSVGVNPLIISVLGALFFKKKINRYVWAGLALGIIGVAVATYPTLFNSSVTPLGITLLAISMVSYSFGTLYYASIEWRLPRLVINGWQIFFGALFLLPLTLLFTHPDQNHLDLRFWGSVFWLVIPVSIIAVQLWLYLLKADSTRAALWLFLCPVLGFFYAWLVLGETISGWTVAGAALVIMGLWVGQRSSND